MNEIFRLKRHIFTRSHPVDHFAEGINLRTVGNGTWICFQITLGSRLTGFQFFNGFALIQWTHIDGNGKVSSIPVKHHIPVKRSKIKGWQLFQSQNVVIHPIPIHSIAAICNGLSVAVNAGVIHSRIFILIDFGKVGSKEFFKVHGIRSNGFVDRREKLFKKFQCRQFFHRKGESTFQQQELGFKTARYFLGKSIHSLF